MSDHAAAIAEIVEAFDDYRFILADERPSGRPLGLMERLLLIGETSPEHSARLAAFGALFCLCIMYPVNDQPVRLH